MRAGVRSLGVPHWGRRFPALAGQSRRPPALRPERPLCYHPLNLGEGAHVPDQQADTVELTVVLPCFNGGKVAVDSALALSAFLSGQGVVHEIIVVDDGSADDTAHRLAALQPPGLRVLVHPGNRGKGAAVKTGLRAMGGRYVVFTDHDLPYGPASVSDCLLELRRGAHLVIGDRTLAGSRLEARVPVMRRFISRSLLFLIDRFLPRLPTRDTQCGLKGMSSWFAGAVLDRSRIDRFSFDLEVVAIGAANRVPLIPIPVALKQPMDTSPRLLMESALALRDFFRIAWNVRAGRYQVIQGPVSPETAS